MAEHQHAVNSLAVSSSRCNWFASASSDGTVKLWGCAKEGVHIDKVCTGPRFEFCMHGYVLFFYPPLCDGSPETKGNLDTECLLCVSAQCIFVSCALNRNNGPFECSIVAVFSCPLSMRLMHLAYHVLFSTHGSSKIAARRWGASARCCLTAHTRVL